jgi:hypothetical protein
MHRFLKWRDALNGAPDEKSLAAVVREYVKALDPKLIDALPPECLGALSEHMDIETAAVVLLHSDLAFRGDAQLAELLHEVAHTFAAASIRLSRLRTEPLVPPPK